MVVLLTVSVKCHVSALPRQTVIASCFDDKMGYRGNNLYDGGYYYAELSNNYLKPDFSALGNLPYKYKLRISYGGKSVVATKGDIGAGGPHNPKIDLHLEVAQYFGFANCNKFGIRTVTIESA